LGLEVMALCSEVKQLVVSPLLLDNNNDWLMGGRNYVSASCNDHQNMSYTSSNEALVEPWALYRDTECVIAVETDWSVKQKPCDHTDNCPLCVAQPCGAGTATQ
jgi:hypothetical protein